LQKSLQKEAAMLQPRSYPELIGKALVLESEPFDWLVDDDNPWAEGLFLVIAVGAVAGVARLIGSLLTAGSLPPAPAVEEALVQGWRHFFGATLAGSDPAAGEAWIRWAWGQSAASLGFLGPAGGWRQLLLVVWSPLGLLVQWLVAGTISFIACRVLGGRGTLNQTLGATALMAAPYILCLLAAIPFVTVSGVLLGTWSLLVFYRGLEVAHQLPWQRAMIAALAPLVLVAAIGLASLGFVSLLLWV
jgi:hypothetical protein